MVDEGSGSRANSNSRPTNARRNGGRKEPSSSRKGPRTTSEDAIAGQRWKTAAVKYGSE